MERSGVNSYCFVNAHGKAYLVKFHWKPLLGVQSLAWNKSLKLGGFDPDFHCRDLWETIERGEYPEWEFGVQLIPAEDQRRYEFDPRDATKISPEEVVPVRRIGKLMLNRLPAELAPWSSALLSGNEHAAILSLERVGVAPVEKREVVSLLVPAAIRHCRPDCDAGRSEQRFKL
jgi:hypothetical protein